MENQEIKDVFEAFFRKYRKSEGDDNTYTAFWSEIYPGGTVEIVMTRCPEDTTFKFFVDKKKVIEVKEWDAFFPAMRQFSQDYSQLFDPETFFSGMREMT